MNLLSLYGERLAAAELFEYVVNACEQFIVSDDLKGADTHEIESPGAKGVGIRDSSSLQS